MNGAARQRPGARDLARQAALTRRGRVTRSAAGRLQLPPRSNNGSTRQWLHCTALHLDKQCSGQGAGLRSRAAVLGDRSACKVRSRCQLPSLACGLNCLACLPQVGRCPASVVVRCSGQALHELPLRRSSRAFVPTAALLMSVGFLVVWLSPDVRGSWAVLPRGWHEETSQQRNMEGQGINPILGTPHPSSY